MPDKLYFVLKLVAATVSGVYGFYATVTDFRVEKKGQKVLSRKGYFGLALLVLATAISLSTDTEKEHRDDEAEAKTATALKALIDEGNRLQAKLEDTSRTLATQVAESKTISDKLDHTGKKLDMARSSLGKTAKTTDTILTEARRLADPIKRDGLTVALKIRIPDQPLIRSYFDRIGRDAGRKVDFYLSPEDERFPDSSRPEERELARLARFMGFDVSFGFHIRDVVGKKVYEDETLTYLLSLRLRCGADMSLIFPEDYYQRGPTIHPRISKHLTAGYINQVPVIFLSCGTSDVGWHAFHGISSWRDLKFTKPYVQIVLADGPPESQLKYTIDYLEASQGDDRMFTFFDFKPCSERDKGNNCFSSASTFGD